MSTANGDHPLDVGGVGDVRLARRGGAALALDHAPPSRRPSGRGCRRRRPTPPRRRSAARSARPMPEPAPVTMATFPDSSIRASSRTADAASSVRRTRRRPGPGREMGVASDVVRVPGDRRHRPPRPDGRDDPGRARRRGRPRRAARGQPAPPARRRPRVVGVQPGQARASCARPTTTCSSWCATPTCCSTAAGASTRPTWPPSTRPSSTSRSARSAATARRPTGRRRTSRSSPPAAPQALNGDSDRAPVRTSVPQAWLHAGAEAAVGALLALTERATQRPRPARRRVGPAGRACRPAIPGVLLAPNDNPEAQRTSGGILDRPDPPPVRLPGARRLRLDHAAVRHDDRPVHGAG